MLLSQLTRDIVEYAPLVRHASALAGVWPTVWIWIRLLRGQVGAASKRPSTAKKTTYTVLVQALLFFLGHVRPGIGLRPPDSALTQLCTLVKKTDGVLQMMATFWIEEAKNEKATMGFPASGLLSDSLSPARAEVEPLVIAGCGGSAKKVAKLALRRIARNLRWVRQQNAASLYDDSGESMAESYYYQLREDVENIHETMDQPSSALHGAFSAQPGFLPLFVDVLRQLLDYPTPQNGLICIVMHTVIIRIQHAQRPYAGIQKLLKTPLFDVVARAGTVASLALSPFSDYCNLLFHVLGVFCVYRRVLSGISRGFRVTNIPCFKDRKDLPISASLCNFKSRANSLVEAYKNYKDALPPVFCCANIQCDRTDHEGTLYRCSGCNLALYCSTDCQKREWRGPHKILCSAMNKAAKGKPRRTAVACTAHTGIDVVLQFCSLYPAPIFDGLRISLRMISSTKSPLLLVPQLPSAVSHLFWC
ncbi:hypothetical protein FIBSPDRAFT_518910 [Athelia psychrophila]|uniref:MYND-type domain-containing protein n=1 Tax=Athelia psychrophila TaxID=1759441 RepID=A0A166V894_9AGAM|nr:hypothetical protein FIBSPDRAFT_518910 [Fibularhizoctonia sp. CBS 109695]